MDNENKELKFLVNCYTNEYFIEKSKIEEKLKKDIKSINEKLYSKEYINLYRTYRLKGMKTKCQELNNNNKSKI